MVLDPNVNELPACDMKRIEKQFASLMDTGQEESPGSLDMFVFVGQQSLGRGQPTPKSYSTLCALLYVVL